MTSAGWSIREQVILSMSFQYMPLYTGDYLRDTRHLTPLKHGIFMLLLMHCWDQKGPIPLDEQEMAGIANCRSADEIDSLRYVLEKYFVKMDDGWYNKRMSEEVAKSEVISSNRQKAGQLGAAIRNRGKARSKHLSESQANAEHMLSTSQALAEQVPSTSWKTIDHNPILTLDLNPNPKTPTVDQPLSPVSVLTSPTQVLNQLVDTEKKSTKKSTSLRRASRIATDWSLPLEWGEWAMRERPTFTNGDASQMADRFRDYWIAKPGKDGTKLDWFATWRNWVRSETRIRGSPASVSEQNQAALAEWKTQHSQRIIDQENET